ncbi:MAG TPA: hypothetical protein C5S50_03420 [Methanosarcinaceae archaeon]|nr:hypothetical protein [Methanosarcinaceae archaeon]
MTKSASTIIIIFVLLITSCFFAGCISENSGIEEATSNPGQELVIPLGDREITMDPLGTSTSWHVRPLIFETLVVADIEGNHPGLATSWNVSEDGMTWTFHLREGVKFHDNTPFDAFNANYSIYKFLETGKSYRFKVESIQTPDDHTLVIALKDPYGPFLDGMGSIWMVSPGCYDKEGKFKEAIGTGPFIPVTYSKQEVVLKSNPDYWDVAPIIKKVTIKVIPDATTQIMALEAGELDIVGADQSGASYSYIKRFEDDPRFVIYKRNQSQIEFLGFNLNNEFFSDKRVREAINYGIDRQAIINSVLEGYGVPAKGPIGHDSSIPWTNTKINGYSYDPEMAAKLLKDAGWEDKDNDGVLEMDGKRFEVTLIHSGHRSFNGAMTEIIQAQLAKIGIKINIMTVERGAFSSSLQKKDFDMAVIPNYGKGETDPYPYLFMFFHSKGTYHIMENETFDRLYYQSMSTVDPDKRKVMYDKMQDVIMEECVAAFLMHPGKTGIAKKELNDFELKYGFGGFTSLKKAYLSD